MKIFWKGQNLESLESVIFCAAGGADYDAGFEKALRFLFVELEAFMCPKIGLKFSPQKPIFCPSLAGCR